MLWQKKNRLHYRLFQDILPFVFSVIPCTKQCQPLQFFGIFGPLQYLSLTISCTLHTRYSNNCTRETWKQFSFQNEKVVLFFHKKKGKKINPQVLGCDYHDSIFKQQPQKNSSVFYFNCINPIWINFIKPVSIQRCIPLIFLSPSIYKRKNKLMVSSQM